MIYPVEYHDYAEAHTKLRKGYLHALFEEFGKRYYDRFIMLKYTDSSRIAIELMYDSRSGKRANTLFMGRLYPLEWCSVKEFIDREYDYADDDELRIIVDDGGKYYSDNLFDTYILLVLVHRNLSNDCRDALTAGDRDDLPAAIASKYCLRDHEQAAVANLLDEITREVITEMQFQYDSLKKLKCIVK